MPTFSSENALKQYVDYYDAFADKVYEVAVYYAAEALNYFRTVQKEVPKNELGAFWHNRSRKAATAWYTKAYRTPTAIGFYASHGVDIRYADDLEFGYEGKYASLKPVMDLYVPPFLESVRNLARMRNL